jgi:hypothetical protein
MRGVMPGFLAPNPRWSALSQTGFAAAGGRLYTYQANSTTPKLTYADSLLQVPNGNPVVLDSKGEHIIYWNDDALYRIELYDSNGNKIYTQDNYPIVGGNATITAYYFDNRENVIRNPQFTFWDNTDSFTNLGLQDDIATDWQFTRNNTNATLSITQQSFGLGQTDVENNPLSYLEYECTDIGAAGETYKSIYQSYANVQTLAAQEIVVAIWARSTSLSQITVSVDQFFGTGGSPSATVSTTVITQTLTATWTKYSATVTLPNVNGKTLGNNGDDELRFSLNLPLNAVALIGFENIQFQKGNTLTTFPYLTQEKDFQRIQQLINQAVFQTGDVKPSFSTADQDGWLLMADGTIGNVDSNATQMAATRTKGLYNFLWNAVSNDWCPVMSSAGVPVTRGATADDDFNADNQLAIPRVLGRVLASSGLGGFSTQFFIANNGLFQMNVATSIGITTGTAFTVSTTDTLPSPLAIATTYYVIHLSDTTFDVASSLANALAEIAIPITTLGIGIQTMQYALTNTYALGEQGGEETHIQLEDELASHVHVYDQVGTGAAVSQSGSDEPTFTGVAENTESTGLSTPFNIIQPTLFVNHFIKL